MAVEGQTEEYETMNMMTGTPVAPAAPRPPIALLRALPPGPLAKKYRKLKRMAKMFAAFDRDDMELAVDLLLAEMDAKDGDPDAEAVGDELDGSPAEDDFWLHGRTDWYGPGCPVSDGDSSTEGGAGDPSWPENEERQPSTMTGYADDHAEPDGRDIRRPYRDRIRAERCKPVYRKDFYSRAMVVDGYRLLDRVSA